MQFELTPALIDEILFFMEDQDGDFLLDTRKGAVFNNENDEFNEDDEDDAEDDEDNRYISLPEWEPSDGFRLMERFTAGLRNALVREELSAALDRGRGVFRAFKDTLSRYPETERLWYSYKDREMKREVIAWYNSLRESWGLEIIGEEPEDTAGLVLEDFRFRPGEARDKTCAEELHRVCLTELRTKFSPHNTKFDTKFNSLFGIGERELKSEIIPGDVWFVAETAGEEFAGFINAIRNDNVLCINAVEVMPEYRGLGLAKTLVARLLEQADSEKIPHVIIDLPAGQEHFSRALLREDFKPCVERYVRTVTE